MTVKELLLEYAKIDRSKLKPHTIIILGLIISESEQIERLTENINRCINIMKKELDEYNKQDS